MNNPKLWKGLFAAIGFNLVVAGSIWLFLNRSGAGPEVRADTLSRLPPEPRPYPRPSVEPVHDEAGASLLAPELEVPNPPKVGPVNQENQLGSILADYDFGTSAEAIAWLTIEPWGQPEFLELSEDEAHELLALDDLMGLKGPGLMTGILGQPPTREDCEVAAGFATVQELLHVALAWNTAIVELGGAPAAARGPAFQRGLEQAVRAKDDAEIALMAELDSVTSFKLWRAWWTVYRRWSAGG